MDYARRPLRNAYLTTLFVWRWRHSRGIPSERDGLCVFGLDDELWRFMVSQVRGRTGMERYVRTALEELAAGRSLPFAIVSLPDQTVVGCTRNGNTDLHNRLLLATLSTCSAACGRSIVAEEWRAVRAALEQRLAGVVPPPHS